MLIISIIVTTNPFCKHKSLIFKLEYNTTYKHFESFLLCASLYPFWESLIKTNIPQLKANWFSAYVWDFCFYISGILHLRTHTHTYTPKNVYLCKKKIKILKWVLLVLTILPFPYGRKIIFVINVRLVFYLTYIYIVADTWLLKMVFPQNSDCFS